MSSFRNAALYAALLLSQASLAHAGPIDTGKVEAASQSEEDELDIIIRQVKHAIDTEDFAKLDSMDHEFRTSRARLPSGIWKLAAFHAGLKYFLTEGLTREQGCILRHNPFIEHWRTISPSSPAVIITEARLQVSQAWCIRGAGYANSVPASAWRPFREGMDKAHSLLLANRDAASVDPEYYAMLAIIYRAKGVDPAQFMRMVDEATDREPYYHRTYFNAAWYFMPQWGGSFEELDNFARYAANKTQSSDNMGLYARVYWSLIECGCIEIGEEADWQTMKQGMRDIYERYPVPFNGEFFRNLSCERGDTEEGLYYIRALTPEVMSDADRVALIDSCKYAAREQR